MGFFEEAIRINREKCKLHEGYNDWEIEGSIVKDILEVNPSLEEYIPRVEYNKKGQFLGANTYYFRAYLLYKSTNKGLRTQLVKALKKSGATDIYDSFSSSIFFNMDVDERVARLDAEKQQKLDQRKQAVSHIDIGKYKPSPTILQKIKDYQARGSRVNVKAIKDPDKLFTYYYAAKMIGFSQLLDAINDITSYADSDILEAIDLNVKTEKQDIGNEGFLSQFQPLVEYCVDHNIKWEAIRRNPSNVEMDPDVRNGRIWTLAYTFTAKGQSFKLAVHTDEGGGRPKGYSLDEREFSSLHAVCDAVIAKLDNIRENLAKKKLREDRVADSTLDWKDIDAMKALIGKSMGRFAREIPQIAALSYHYPGIVSSHDMDWILYNIYSALDWKLDRISPWEAEYSYGVTRDYRVGSGTDVSNMIESGKVHLFDDYREAIDYAESITKPDSKQTHIYLIVGNKDKKISTGSLWLKILEPTEKIIVSSPAYNEILNLVKGDKKAANIVKNWLGYVTWESPEELKDVVDSYIEDMLQEGGNERKKAKIVADALGQEPEEPSFPEIFYVVYELDENGDELDDVKSFDTAKEAIAFAKKQSFPTHVVFVPEDDPDNDPDYAAYIENNYDYEPFEVIWESEVNESLKHRREMRESIQALPGVKRVNISDFEELYWDPYRAMGTSRVTGNSLGSDVNYADIFYSEITYDEDLDQWNVYMGPYEDYAQGKTIAEAVKKAYGRLKGTLHKEISKKIDDSFFAESPEYNLTGKFEYIGSAIDDAEVKYDATSLEDGDWFELYFVDYGHVDDLKNKEARESLRSRKTMKESYKRVR